MNYYQLFQLEKYGDYLPENYISTEDDYENDMESLRLAEFIETMNELQRMEDEN